MAYDSPHRSNHEPAPGLPPVAPPSGKFLFQLFIVPLLLIVGIPAVCLLFLGMSHWLVGSPSNPEQFLKNLDDANPEVRWRAAQDLTQVLLRDKTLASNPRFALDLAERLRQAWDGYRKAEKELAERLRDRSPDDTQPERKTLEPEQNYIRYLTASLGNFVVPAGVPLLRELADEEGGLDARAAARRRWQAVWSLANLGNNLEGFAKLDEARQEEVLAELEQEAAASTAERRAWAQLTLDCLNDQRAGRPRALGVDQTLVRCASDPNPFLRVITALALNFWQGNPAENARMEEALVKLSYDRGQGQELVEPFFEADEYQAEAIVGRPGSEIRYNATVALARRGSGKVRLGLLEEMLDEAGLQQNFRVKNRAGQEVPNEPVIVSTLNNALKAVAQLHRKKPGLDLATLRPAVETLTRHRNPAVRTEAERTRLALDATN